MLPGASVAVWALPTSLGAQDWQPTVVPATAEYSYEAWAGADATAGSWSTYSGATAALGSGDVRGDGFKLRTAAGYGRYRYARPYFDPFRRRLIWPEFHGRMTNNDLLLGYQQAFGATLVKVFAGITEERHGVSPEAGSVLAFDDENAVQGTRRGLKLNVETWTQLGHWGFVQAEFGWSQPFEAYGGRVRFGYRFGPHWSFGPEAAAFGNVNHDHGRVGAFLRFEWSRGEVSISAGADGDQKGPNGAYGSLNAIYRF